jgi:serine/tyrosine/threonine adenylyltransferase
MHSRVRFDNRFVQELPGDPEQSGDRRQVHGACWSSAMPTAVSAPRLVAHAYEVAQLLGFTSADVESPAFAEVFGGNQLLRTPPVMVVTSSGSGPDSLVTVAPSRLAKW